MDIVAIQKRIEQVDKITTELKINREMLKGELENEPAYLEAKEEAKVAGQKKKQIKDEILGRGPNQEVLVTMKDSQEELATLKEILTAELIEFYQESKVSEISNRKIKFNATLAPKKGENRNSFGQYSE